MGWMIKMRKPLDGIKIFDLTHYSSGPICTLFLSDYGAEVIRIESPKTHCDVVSAEEKCARATFHRGKKTVILDLNEESDRKVFQRLCTDADGVVENFRPGKMEQLGITYEFFREANPAIVYTSISGYGQDGPYAEREVSDSTIQAEAGLMSITGPRGKESVRCGANVASYLAALMGCIGTLVGVISAKRTGKGQRVDISMMDTTMLCLENQLAVYLRDGIVPKPMGNSYDLFAPVGLYHTHDQKEFMLSVGTDRQWKALCDALGKEEWIEEPKYVTNMRRVENTRELDHELGVEFEKYDREELSGKFQSAHCVYGNINNFKAVEEHPQLAERKMIFRAEYPDGSSYRVPGNPIQMSGMERQTVCSVYPPGYWNDVLIEKDNKRNERRKTMLPIPTEKQSAEKLLKGVRILDFSQFLSGPMCTLMLSDFGAEVIKIENPPLGDNTRYGPYIEREVSSHYAMRNRGKKSIVLNMKNEEHKELFFKLVKNADAVVDNYKPGTMEKFGITYEVLKKINPRIVFTSISGYGQAGPYASHAAFDQPVQAESGFMSITGEKGGMPVKCGASVADVAGGLVACVGTLMGIYDAQQTGCGRRIDVSMMDSLIFGLGNQFSSYLRTGKIPGPRGNREEQAAPSGVYRCKDGTRMAVTVYSDEQWVRFCEALGKTEWKQNKEWSTQSKREAESDRLDEEISRVFACYTSEELEQMMLEKQCICGKVNDFSAVRDHPQVKHRQTFVNAVFPNGVSFLVPGNPIHIDGMKRKNEYAAAPLGYHTYEVLSEVADEETLHRIFEPVLADVRKAEKAIYDKS